MTLKHNVTAISDGDSAVSPPQLPDRQFLLFIGDLSLFSHHLRGRPSLGFPVNAVG